MGGGGGGRGRSRGLVTRPTPLQLAEDIPHRQLTLPSHNPVGGDTGREGREETSGLPAHPLPERDGPPSGLSRLHPSPGGPIPPGARPRLPGGDAGPLPAIPGGRRRGARGPLLPRPRPAPPTAPSPPPRRAVPCPLPPPPGPANCLDLGRGGGRRLLGQRLSRAIRSQSDGSEDRRLRGPGFTGNTDAKAKGSVVKRGKGEETQVCGRTLGSLATPEGSGGVRKEEPAPRTPRRLPTTTPTTTLRPAGWVEILPTHAPSPGPRCASTPCWRGSDRPGARASRHQSI